MRYDNSESDLADMEDAAKQSIDEILTTLENAVSHETVIRMSHSKIGPSPKNIHSEAKQAITALITEARREALTKWDLTALTGTYDSALMVALHNGGYTIKLPDCAIDVDEKNKIITVKQLGGKKL